MKKITTYLLAFLLLIPFLSNGQASFSPSITNGCVPLVTQFYNASHGLGTYSWDFGDGGTSTLCSPMHVFQNAGTYSVVLTFTNVDGTYTHTETVVVNPTPIPVISGVDTICELDTALYTAAGSGNNYYWSSDAGTVVSGQGTNSVDVLWTTFGNQLLTLTETNSFGCSKSVQYNVYVAALPHLGNLCDPGRKEAVPGNEKDSALLNILSCVCKNSQTVFNLAEFMGNHPEFNYIWSVSSGSIVSGQGTQQAVVQWGTGPTIDLQVIAINEAGCTDTAICTFEVCPEVEAEFSSDTACFGNITILDASQSDTQSQIVSYDWDFGDNTYASSIANNMTHTFLTSGNHDVTLLVENSSGCKDTVHHMVYVDSFAGPKIVCPSTVCNGSTQWYSTDFYAGAVYNWSADGGAVVGSNPTNDSVQINWGNGPVGYVYLEVLSGSYNCTKGSVYVPIFPNSLNAEYPEYLCESEPNYINVAHVPGTCYNWTITGGTYSPASMSNNDINLTPNAGVTSVTILVSMKNELACCFTDTTFTIPVRPKLKVYGEDYICEYSTETYNSNGPVTWSVVNGAIVTSTTTSVTINWGSEPAGIVTGTSLTPGTFCNNSVSVNINLKPKPLPYTIIGDNAACQNSSAPFSANLPSGVGIKEWYSNPTTGVTFATSTSNPTDITFANTGTFNIHAIYEKYYTKPGIWPPDTFKCYDTAQKTVLVISDSLPTIYGLDTVCRGDVFKYTIGSNPDSLYEWSVVGGVILNGQYTDTVNIEWGSASMGLITLSNPLCGTNATKNIVIKELPGIAIELIDSTCDGSSITIQGPAGFASYNWTPVGGTSQTAIITTAGTYTLTVSDGYCLSSISETYSPLPTRPIPVVTINTSTMSPSTFCPPIQEICATYDANFTYSWTSVGGAISPFTGTNQCMFDSIGTYTVTVTNQFGCTATESVTLTPGSCVSGGPCKSRAQPNCTYNQCLKKFTNTSLFAVSYFWDFGDGTFSNDINPIHQYGALGTYTVNLTAWDAKGCPRTKRTTVTITSIMEAIPTMSPVACQCGTFNFNATALSTTLSTGTVFYDWVFGDGNTSTVANPTHTYSGTGPYTVTLTVHDNVCKDTFTYTHSFECIDPTIFTCGGCSNQAIQFVDASTRLSTTTSWSWDFGDGNTSNLENPWHVYSSPGTYEVTLSFYDFYGCQYFDTLDITVGVFNAGAVTYTVNGNVVTPSSPNTYEICEGDVLVAAGPTGGGFNYFWSTGTTTQNDSITEPGVYTLVVINTTNCYDSIGPFNVIVNPRPYASLTGEATVCAKPTSALVATQGLGYSYMWRYNGSATLYTQYFKRLFSTSQSGNWEVIITNSYGCKDSVIHTVTVLPNDPIITTVSNYNFCEGDSSVITVTSPYTSLIWSNGATTASITSYRSGRYTVTILNSNGCYSTKSITVNMKRKPDLSIIPFGCYKICEFSHPTVCGPVNVGYSNLQYKWYDANTNTVVATTANYVPSYASEFYLEVTDLTTGCMNVSDTFSVDVVSAPLAEIAQGDITGICNSGSTVTLDALNYDYQYNYTWFHGTTQIGTGPSVTVTGPGTYILTVGINECCQTADTIIIVEEDCCWDSTVNFTYIPDGYTISSNEIWDGKYYVAGKVYITGKSTLDMTTIDVVFDSDGELIFQDSSCVRATNSVFRPCEKYSTWVGFTFKDISKGWVLTSTFKNATTALDIVNFKDFSVKIADNTFSNCHVGVNIDKGNDVYTEGVTGNSFLVDDDNLPFVNNNYFGIKLNRVKMAQLISLNKFRYSHVNRDGNTFDGIFLTHSGGVISENTFTNMRRSIDITQCIYQSSIENNEIEIVQTAHNVTDQIRISDNELPILVFSNEIRSSMNIGVNFNAILLSNVRSLEIKENHIKGYYMGIRGSGVFNSVIMENEIDQSDWIGMYINNSSNTDISCNIIRMKKFNTNNIYPIGIALGNSNSSNRIFTNCIFDCGVSTYLFASTGTPIPLFKNNYLYNYSYTGVYNWGYVGNLGFSSTFFANAGRNSFISNNHGGGALDILSFSPISEGGNYGVNVTSGVSSFGSQNRFASTASCGHQILDPKRSKIDALNRCDSYWYKKEQQHYENGDQNQRVVNSKYKDGIVNVNEFVEEFSKVQFVGLVKFMVYDGKLAAAEKSISNARKSGLFNMDVLDLTMTQCYLNVNDITNAENILAQMSVSNNETNLMKYILHTQINIAKEKRHDITDEEFKQLKLIDDARGMYANQARDMIHLYRGMHPFVKEKDDVNIDITKNIKIVSRDKEFLQVYPNPASNSLNLMFNIETDEELTVQIFDLNGRVVQSSKVNGGAQAHTLDISDLSSGSYIMSLKNNKNEIKFYDRFVKL